MRGLLPQGDDLFRVPQPSPGASSKLPSTKRNASHRLSQARGVRVSEPLPGSTSPAAPQVCLGAASAVPRGAPPAAGERSCAARGKHVGKELGRGSLAGVGGGGIAMAAGVSSDHQRPLPPPPSPSLRFSPRPKHRRQARHRRDAPSLSPTRSGGRGACFVGKSPRAEVARPRPRLAAPESCPRPLARSGNLSRVWLRRGAV